MFTVNPYGFTIRTTFGFEWVGGFTVQKWPVWISSEEKINDLLIHSKAQMTPSCKPHLIHMDLPSEQHSDLSGWVVSRVFRVPVVPEWTILVS